MKQVKLRITDSLWRRIKAELQKSAPREDVLFLFCKKSETYQCMVLIAYSIVIPSPDQLAIQSSGAIGVTPKFLQMLLAHCIAEKLHLLACHSHPFCETGVRFSSIDDEWDSRFGGYTAHTMPWMLHGSIVFGNASWDARYYDKVSRSLRSIQRITVVGDGIDWINPTSSERPDTNPTDTRYDRQNAFFGRSGQCDLWNAKIAVVGLGGLGSMVVQQLAHAGIGHLVLIDPDVVEKHNLNRLVGANACDAERNEYKVRVADRLVRGVNPSIEITVVAQSITECADVLKDVDVLINCVDTQSPRLLCTRFPAQYLVPVIDVGSGVAVEVDKLTGCYGQVRVVLPHGPCLCCMGGIDRRALRRELLPRVQREWETEQGYGAGAGSPMPSIISLNGTLASLAVTELLNLIGHFRKPAYYIYYDGMDVSRVAYGIAISKREDCPVCGPEAFAMGDDNPLPSFSSEVIQIPNREDAAHENPRAAETVADQS